jgi:hypothetical protein
MLAVETRSVRLNFSFCSSCGLGLLPITAGPIHLAGARPRHGKLSDVKHTDRLGERELALRYLARAVCVSLRVDRERHSL